MRGAKSIVSPYTAFLSRIAATRKRVDEGFSSRREVHMKDVQQLRKLNEQLRINMQL